MPRILYKHHNSLRGLGTWQVHKMPWRPHQAVQETLDSTCKLGIWEWLLVNGHGVRTQDSLVSSVPFTPSHIAISSLQTSGTPPFPSPSMYPGQGSF